MAAVAAVLAVLVVAVGALVLAGGDDEGGSTSTTQGGDSTAGAIDDLEDVAGATVQIVSQGSFVDPVEGVFEDAAGSGSGFVIDESGIAVTNNHVVTGAATLEVVVGGDLEDTRNATVLATSECSDLAVIDIEGDGYPFMAFYDGEISAGLEVFAAGFPLGDPEFTLTEGIVAKAQASGETSWASVDDVIQHTADINPGNSGGPLVTAEGKVVGVNYAGDVETNQYFAIAPPTATDVVADLREGRSVDYLGINGQAVVSDEAGVTGVWVAAVESGSPAAELGLEGGDIIERMEGLSLALDGTLADYCDIIRTKGPEGEISAQVLRYETDELLRGTFNSGDELEVADYLGSELEDEVAGGGPDSYDEYTVVEDDTGAIEVELPVEWSEVDGAPLDDGTPNITAATSLEGFAANFVTPGVYISVTSEVDASDPDTVLAAFLEGIGATGACPGTAGSEEYDDGLYTGRFQFLSGCDGTDASFLGIVASSADGDVTFLVGVQVAGQADLEAADRISATFRLAE